MDGSKHRILEAAETVFARYGFRQTTMGLVADESELSRQALYRYYDTKEALFEAVLHDLHERALVRAAEAGERAREAGAGLPDRLVAQVLARAGVFSEKLAGSAHASELVDATGRQFAGIAAEYGGRFEAVLVATVEEGRDDALAAAISAPRLVALVLAVARGLKTAEPRLSAEAYAAEVTDAVRMLVDGAAPAGRPSGPLSEVRTRSRLAERPRSTSRAGGPR